MALPLQPGLLPSEVAFLCEMELVTVVPRQRLDPIALLGGTTPALRPPHRAALPLWLALLLKRQRRANIVAPPWLHPASLTELIQAETRDDGDAGAPSASGSANATSSLFPTQQSITNGPDGNATVVRFAPPPPPPVRADERATATAAGQAKRVTGFASDPFAGADVPLSPPFLPSCTAEAPAGHLPYHWFEVAEILVAHAPDDLPAPVGEVRALLRDLAEARAAKVRQLAKIATARRPGLTDGGRGGAARVMEFTPAAVTLRGIGAMELAEARGLVVAVHDGVRRLGAAAEGTRREEEETGATGAAAYDEYSDDDML